MSEGKKSRKTAGVKKNSRKEPAQYNRKIQQRERGRQAQGQRTRYKDDRTPFVRTIEPACRIIAVVLSMVLWADVHVLLRGGGYADTTIVPVFGYADSKVESTSMEPAIPARSVIVTKQQPEYQVDDIVLYRSSEEENGLRRVVSAEGGQYRVLGDNRRNATDGSEGRYLGKGGAPRAVVLRHPAIFPHASRGADDFPSGDFRAAFTGSSDDSAPAACPARASGGEGSQRVSAK